MAFIKQKDAMIVWQEDLEQKKVIDFRVFEWTLKDIENSRAGGKREPYLDYTCSWGRCCSHFGKMNKTELMCECLFILLTTYPIEHQETEKYLMELCKIEELEDLRKKVFSWYKVYSDNMSYREFLERFF